MTKKGKFTSKIHSSHVYNLVDKMYENTKVQTFETDQNIGSILQELSSYATIGNLEEVRLSPGDAFCYVGGKLYETEYAFIEDYDCSDDITEDALNRDDCDLTSGKFVIYRSEGASGGIWWRLPEDSERLKNALAKEFQTWHIFDPNEGSQVNSKEAVSARVEFDGIGSSACYVGFISEAGKFFADVTEEDDSDRLIAEIFEDNDEAVDLLDEEGEIYQYSTYNDAFFACLIKHEGSAITATYWAIPDDITDAHTAQEKTNDMLSWLAENAGLA